MNNLLINLKTSSLKEQKMMVKNYLNCISAMDVIFQSITKNLPRLKREISKKLSFDIKMVALGIKPSLLIDIVAISDKLLNFEAIVEEINAKSQFLSTNTSKLRIVCVKDDFFIVNFPKILRTIRRKRHYINVSSNLQQPTLMIDYSEIELMAKEVYLQLMNMFDESSENISRSIQLSLHWNITTVFGVLLDYPVVYWYKDKEGETCLGNKDLINFKLKNTAHIKTWAIERDVYSFTVPTCVINEELNSFVEKWLTQLLECANTHNVILTCEKNQVNLSTVLL